MSPRLQELRWCDFVRLFEKSDKSTAISSPSSYEPFLLFRAIVYFTPNRWAFEQILSCAIMHDQDYGTDYCRCSSLPSSRYFLGAIWAQYSRRHPLLPAILLSAFERIILRAISARISSIRQLSCQVCTTSFVLLIAAAAACDHSRCLSDFCIMQQPISVTAALA